MADFAHSSHPGPALFTAFAAGQLADVEREAFEGHLLVCAGCRQVLAALASSTETASSRDLPPTLLSPGSGGRRQANVSLALPPDLANHPRYEILQLLGRGGMGAVYKARHKKMDRLVAVKVIAASLLDNPRAVERFQREVRAAARLEHPHIVRAYDADEAGATHFLVMEFVEGTDLARYVAQQGPLPAPQACELIGQAALGLEHAHRHGMVHRDIKPHNLMLVSADAVVKVTDFGLARLAAENAETALTGDHALVGTADYIAPEQAQDARPCPQRRTVRGRCRAGFRLARGKSSADLG